MKKLYTKHKYKKWHNRRSQKIGRKSKRNKKRNYSFSPVFQKRKDEFIKREPIQAPSNLCLLTNTEKCLIFFNLLRKEKNISKYGRICYVQMTIEKVEKIDYSTICILIAIIGDLKSKGIFFRTDFPINIECKDQIIESGLLEVLLDSKGKPFPKPEKSELLVIEKGSKKLTRTDNIRISKAVKNTVKHLTGEDNHCRQLRTILLEICGNSIEWGGTKNRQWLIGVKYDEDKVIFTITDVGKGILSTLNKKFKQKISDIFTLKNNDEILRGAFIKKYGSSSQKANRNKGLPSIKNGFDDGLIKNLKVLTNDVILHFDTKKESKILNKRESFNGTLYRWIVTRESLNYKNNENN